MFIPSPVKTMLLGVPKIRMTRKVHDDISHVVNIVSTEVGWLGTVDKQVDPRSGEITFVLEEIFVPQQDVHATTTELTPIGIAELYEKIGAAERAAGVARDNPKHKLNRMLFWGHSHVNMGTGASAQDDQQITQFKQNGCPWFVRGIFNKKGQATFHVYYFDWNVELCDVPWEVDQLIDDPRRQFWEKEINTTVKQMGYRGTYQHDRAPVGAPPAGGHITPHGGGYGYPETGYGPYGRFGGD